MDTLKPKSDPKKEALFMKIYFKQKITPELFKLMFVRKDARVV